MTSSNTSGNTSGSTAHPYTREMAMIHQVFRRESRLLAELVQEVPPGDTARAGTLVEHWLHPWRGAAQRRSSLRCQWPALC
ncbi:hypothetical protein [Streptomyces sp. NPDC093568]|uniref:hypothetical protein n=1 Tax=Streptomyces sp. NPDC093568 TaxID=3366041 RepID=UPI00381BDCC5